MFWKLPDITVGTEASWASPLNVSYHTQSKLPTLASKAVSRKAPKEQNPSLFPGWPVANSLAGLGLNVLVVLALRLM